MERLSDVLCTVREFFGDRPATVAEMRRAAEDELDDFAGIQIVDGVSKRVVPQAEMLRRQRALADALGMVAGSGSGKGISAKQLGWYLKHFTGRICEGQKLAVTPKWENRNKRSAYVVVDA
jgi:hypothetical protein